MPDPQHVNAGDQAAADFNAGAQAKMKPAAMAAANALGPRPQSSDYEPAGGGPPTGMPPAASGAPTGGAVQTPVGDDPGSMNAALKLLGQRKSTGVDPLTTPPDISYLPTPTDAEIEKIKNTPDISHLPMPNSVEQGMARFDYSQSPLRHFLSEDNARAMVRASLTNDQRSQVFNNNMEDAGLFFLTQHMKDKMSTALSAIGSDKSWEQLAKEYRDKQDVENAAQPLAAGLGKVSGVATTAATGASALPAEFWPAAGAAAQKAAQVAYPMVKKAVLRYGGGALFGAGAYGAGRKVAKWLEDIL